MNTMVRIENLSKSYSKRQTLDKVNLRVDSGQILGLVGPNGSGKSTCMQALLGLIDYQGEIDVLGHNPKSKREVMLQDVSYISDVSVLPRWLKVSQALDYVQSVHKKFDREKAESFLVKTNIESTAKIKTLSKGMVTQLHLALVLAIDAKVLVLDEPTIGLDILTRRQFYSHLLEEFCNEDKCIVITTHQIEEIEHIITHISLIKDGRIILSESMEELKDRYNLVTVPSDRVDAAKKLNPICSMSLMGTTSMLFDNRDRNQLSQFGDVSIPSLSDIFVGVMKQEKM